MKKQRRQRQGQPQPTDRHRPDAEANHSSGSPSGRWLQSRRRALGMRQTQLAAELGVCVTTLSIWERHGIPIHGKAAERIEETITRLEKQNKGENKQDYKKDKRGYILPLASIQSRLRGRHPPTTETQEPETKR